MAAPRKFDHDEARIRYEAGEPIGALAREFGVSYNAVWGAATERGREWSQRCSRASTRWHREHRQPCKGGCGRLVWITTGIRTGFCPTCFGLERAQTVRSDSLLCSRCEEWKADEDFPVHVRSKARRGRHALCRSCQTAAKRDWRARLTAGERERLRTYDRERRRKVAA